MASPSTNLERNPTPSKLVHMQGEREHSSCNGQEKALQNGKGQLKNDKILLSFLMKSFY